MSARVSYVVQGVHMGTSHLGLAKIAREDLDIDITKLDPDDLIMFLNTKGDKLKVLGGHGHVIGYLKSPTGAPLMKEALQYLPQTFGASGFDYDKACLKALEQRFNTGPNHRRASPLVAAKAMEEMKKQPGRRRYAAT